MKQFDEILTDSGFIQTEYGWIPNGNYSNCLLEVLRGMYENIANGLPFESDIEFDKKRILSTKIADLDVSARLINGLKMVGMKTIHDAISLQRKELFKIINLGEQSIKELDHIVDKYNLRYGELTLSDWLKKKNLKKQ